MRIDLSGRTALVTGSTRGIGRAIAERLAECGARVAIVGRDAAKASEVAGRVSPEARGFGCDVADVASVTALVAKVEEAFGSLDVLVNNAGLTRDNIMLRLKDDDWDAVIDANLRGAFVAIRAATRGMMKRRWGRIINISSVVGEQGRLDRAHEVGREGVRLAEHTGERDCTRVHRNGHDRGDDGRGACRAHGKHPARAARITGRHRGDGGVSGLRPCVVHNGSGARRGRGHGDVTLGDETGYFIFLQHPSYPSQEGHRHGGTLGESERHHREGAWRRT
jgi:NAD(P)-dependent dehydrogenase (short-subunit alcohol dehydrogenase family)